MHDAYTKEDEFAIELPYALHAKLEFNLSK